MWLIQDADGLTLIDSGYEKQEPKILDALAAFGRQPTDIKRIVVTHTHPDHAGGLAHIKRVTNATTYMHPLDAKVVRGQAPMYRATPSPDVMSRVIYKLMIKSSPGSVPPAEIENEIGDGDVLPIGRFGNETSGLRVIHTPGHSAGHTSFLLERDGGLLFAADACSNIMGLRPSVVYDDHAEGRRSLQKLAQLKFAAVCFGHGKPLNNGDAQKFNARWS